MGKKFKVTNLTKQVVRRGGKVFLPLATVEVELFKYQEAEVKACVDLHVEEIKAVKKTSKSKEGDN
ncbi:hypothetical protein [Cytobacillus sp. NCCP-133]|uniref:hypothetical protein n=1 Tax=Cytobacillus sp. NCCP-133 TaxID=766848 RepID=UPI002231D32D|nr:hypothetical protein [Cytobacillus sp. NCCP-133]GLB58672.1 hypothetical protein NCCP133_08050 [Cytobacillus sp. NCCP-133]